MTDELSGGAQIYDGAQVATEARRSICWQRRQGAAGAIPPLVPHLAESLSTTVTSSSYVCRHPSPRQMISTCSTQPPSGNYGAEFGSRREKISDRDAEKTEGAGRGRRMAQLSAAGRQSPRRGNICQRMEVLNTAGGDS